MNSTNTNRPINTINPRSSRFFSTSALTLTLILFLTLTWVLSLREVRLKIGDYYFKQGKFDQAVNWYEKAARKGALNAKTLQPQPLNSVRIKLINTFLLWARSLFDQGTRLSVTNTYLAKIKLLEVLNLFEYSKQSRSISEDLLQNNEFLSIIKRANLSLAEIYRMQEPARIFNLYTKFIELQQLHRDIGLEQKWTALLSSLDGINLMGNPLFEDSDSDGIPDGYTYACIGPDATPPHKECIKTKNYNIYHVWQNKGRGWFATYFNVERAPPNTYFTFSIDIKRVNIEGRTNAKLYTTRLSNGNWGAGNDYSETGVFIDLKDGWKREFHTIKTKDYSDILLSGWIVAWDSGRAGGHIYVCKPKLEIGNKPTL